MRYSPDLTKHIGMIAGGTGITPMLQIIRAIVKNPQDKTKVDLIYANVNVNDILLRDELDSLAKQHPEQFNVLHFLNNPPEKWDGGSGFVDKDSIKERLPAPADDIKILMCGPPPMINAMKKHLEELGYDKPNTVSKLHDVSVDGSGLRFHWMQMLNFLSSPLCSKSFASKQCKLALIAIANTGSV